MDFVIFENTLSSYKDKAGAILEDLVYNLAYKSLKSTPKLKESELLKGFLEVLQRLDLLSQENVALIIKGLIKARINEPQSVLVSYLAELDNIEGKIEQQKNFIKNEISQSFYELKNGLEKTEFKDQISDGISDAFLFEVEVLGILKETAESAFITTLEKGEDIELTSNEIARSLIYNAICEANFEKARILKSSQIVLNCAFDLANEYINYAKELCKGVVKGVQEGIEQGIEKFKTSFAYCTLEEDLTHKEKELIGIEDDFIFLLKTCVQTQQNPAKKILQDMLDNELDTLFAKFKRLANESREQLVLSLNELKKNPKIDDLGRLTQNKIYNFKKEMSDFERVLSEKYKDFNLKEAKNLGINLWQRAKNLIKK